MQKSTSILLLCFLALANCHPPPDDPPPFQTIQLNYSIEDGLWAYAQPDRFFVLTDQTTFDDSTGLLCITTPYPLDSTYCEIIGTNCPSPITAATWNIHQAQSGHWQLIIQLPAATVACIQDHLLWDDDYWSFDFRIRVLPPG